MGLEAECTVRVGRKSSNGKATFEGDQLAFRGDFRLAFAVESLEHVAVDGDDLVVRTADQEARFELGAQAAERWRRAIREPKGLIEKLEVAPGARIAIVDVVDAPFLGAVRERTENIVQGRVPQGAATIFFGAETREALRKIQLLRARMPDSGTLWVIRPKGSKAITEADVLEAVRTYGLVDVKVVAFSKTHTAHKTMIPVELRGKAIPRPPIVSLPPNAPTSIDEGESGESPDDSSKPVTGKRKKTL